MKKICLLAAVLGMVLNCARAQSDGTYSVSEAWSVTIYEGPSNVPTTHTGNETGTVVITNGGYAQINHTGIADLSRLNIKRSISSSGGSYFISGAYPVSAEADGPSGIYAVIQLSFFVVLVPLGSQADVPNPWPSQSSVFTTTGTSLSRLTGTGTMVDQQANTPGEPSYFINKAKASSTAGLSYIGPPPEGSLKVTISPSAAITAGAHWQVDGGPLQSSGATVGKLYVGSHFVTFTSVPGFYQPGGVTVNIIANQTAITNGIYSAIPVGALRVTISPPSAVSAGAQWQIDGGALQNSGATVSNLVTGTHTVSFTAVIGWISPSNQTVFISAGSTATVTGSYVQVAPIHYTIVVSASPSAGGTVTGGGTFPADTSQTVIARANVGYSFVNWTQNGTVVSVSDSYTFTLSTNVYLVANFACDPNNFTYITNNGTITITRYSGCGGAVNIPSTVNDLPVTGIGSSAFEFATSVTSVAIPASVTSISAGAFWDCSSLTAITVDPLNPANSSVAGVLFNKNQTTLVACPGGETGSYTIPSSVTTIGNSAFVYCRNLISISIPTSVADIQAYAFFGCSGLTNVAIPKSVTNIEYAGEVFSDCSRLASITVDPFNPVYSSAEGVLFTKSQTVLIEFPGGKTGAYTAPKIVVTVLPYAFNDCSGLTNVIFPDSVTTIENAAFQGCSGLANITFPDTLTTLGSGVFWDCGRLVGAYFNGKAPIADSTLFASDPDISVNATVYYLPGTIGWSSTFEGRPTAFWALPYPLILNHSPSFGVQNNQFGFAISWATNAYVIVEASTNLSNPSWQRVQTNVLINGTSVFGEPGWSSYPTRFYRVTPK